MLIRSVSDVVLAEGGSQEFSIGPQVHWLPVVVALLIAAVVGGVAVALYLRRRTPVRPVSAPPPSDE
mgnify:CR=1 FL=1